MDFANGRNLGVRLRLIACAVGRRCLLIADGISDRGKRAMGASLRRKAARAIGGRDRGNGETATRSGGQAGGEGEG